MLLAVDDSLHSVGHRIRREAILLQQPVRVATLGINVTDVNRLDRHGFCLTDGLADDRPEATMMQVLFRNDNGPGFFSGLPDRVSVPGA